jgi:hypothetical protein
MKVGTLPVIFVRNFNGLHDHMGKSRRLNFWLSVRIGIEHGQNFGPISVRIGIGHIPT